MANDDYDNAQADWGVLHRLTCCDTLASVREEACRSRAKWGPYRSTHEVLGVLTEEMKELTDAIHANNDTAARAEALQIAAVAYRFARDGWFRAEETR